MTDFFVMKDFTCGYGQKFNVRDISVSIPKGSLTGIIGPNGSGKTTLFKGITGELRCASGSAFLDSKNLNLMPLKEKARNLAVVTQNLDMIDITVEDYIIMGRYPYFTKFQMFETDEDIQLVEKYMKLVGILSLRHKFLYQLSGGEVQLTAITRALIQEPKLLLLDEPTSHLDVTHQLQVLNLIQKLNSHMGLTVLMIIHDLNLAAEYCDQLILINKGQMHIMDTPDKVLTYKNIEDVYGAVVVTNTNPVSGKPVIFPISDKVLQKMKPEEFY